MADFTLVNICYNAEKNSVSLMPPFCLMSNYITIILAIWRVKRLLEAVALIHTRVLLVSATITKCAQSNNETNHSFRMQWRR